MWRRVTSGGGKMKANTRDGQRAIAKQLAAKLGKHSIARQTRHMRKLQCQVLITALLHGRRVEIANNGDLKVRVS